MKNVVMFPGQGSQYKGMGKELFVKYKSETQVASKILGYDIEDLCVNDPKRQLVKTQFTQPAIYVVNSFLYREYNKVPDYVIGHSLGEYNALLAAEAFDFETGLRLVKKRGELMASVSGGSMAAVLGLNISQLHQKLKVGKYSDVDIANYNSPTQTVLSGTTQSINAIIKDFSKEDIKIVPLFVSAPFHSRYMQPAVQDFSDFLKEFEFNKLKIPVIANATALLYEDNKIADLLSSQISSSVLWSDSIRYLMGENVSKYDELGGDMLAKMTEEIRDKCEPIKIQNSISTNKKNKSETEKPKIIISEEKEMEDNKHNKLSRKLGDSNFREEYGVSYSYVAGGMYRGTASKELVIRMGKAKMLAFLGAGGMSLDEISKNIDYIQSKLSHSEPYGFNLLHHLTDPDFEMKTVELFLKRGIKNIEAAAFMQMTESLVYFRVSGLEKKENGDIHCNHRIIGKVSRPEVAEVFMRPAPDKFINSLLEKGVITKEQAIMAKTIPMAYDICVEADSGGHTDSGVATVLLPSIQFLRDDLQNKYKYPKQIRVGLAGGIGTPQSIASAFVMKADFVLTGSINQCTVEAGTSDEVKDLLENINVQDTDYAPAGDMFEIGAKVQVLKKGVLFPARANKLYNLYNQYSSLEEIPEKTRQQLERNYFKKPISSIWEETKEFFIKLGKTNEITKAEKVPKHKMALVFRWYFGFSSRSAFAGDMENKVNFQIHTGPALGAFNQWVKGTDLESWRNRHVDLIGKKLMESTAELLENTLSTIDQ